MFYYVLRFKDFVKIVYFIGVIKFWYYFYNIVIKEVILFFEIGYNKDYL